MFGKIVRQSAPELAEILHGLRRVATGRRDLPSGPKLKTAQPSRLGSFRLNFSFNVSNAAAGTARFYEKTPTIAIFHKHISTLR